MAIMSMHLHTLCLVAQVWDEELVTHWEIKCIARIYGIVQGNIYQMLCSLPVPGF